MKMFLLRHYAKAFTDRGMLFVVALAMPAGLLSAWMFPNALGVWTAAVLALVGGSVLPQRPSLYESSLPISGKDIAVVRFVLAFVLLVTPVVLAAFVIHWVHGVPLPAYEMFESAAIVALAVVLPRMVRPREFAVSPGDTLSPVLPMGVLAALSIFYLGNIVSLALLLITTVVAVTWWWRIVPASFEAAPRSVSARDEARSSGTVSDIAGRVPWWKVVRATLWTKNRAFSTAILVLLGYAGNWPLFLTMLLMTEELWQRPRWMQHLPVSHRARLWMMLGPGVFLPMLAILCGVLLHIPGYDFMQGVNRSQVNTDTQEPKYFDSPSSVSLDFWEVARDSLPVITAPWGETAEPYVVRVFGRVYYNPFTSRKANSDRFAGWQFERATTAVFGHPIPLAGYDDSQLHPLRITQRPRMLVLNIAAATVFAFVLLISTGWVKWHRAWRHQKIAVVFYIATYIPLGLFFYSLKDAFQAGTILIVPQLIERQLLNLSAVLPKHLLVVVCIAAIPVVALYAVLEWQFRNSEIVGAMPRV